MAASFFSSWAAEALALAGTSVGFMVGNRISGFCKVL